MLPQELKSDRILYLQRKVQELGEDMPAKLLPLEIEDFQLFGSYIQLYNYIVLNLRRSVEACAIVGGEDPQTGILSHAIVDLADMRGLLVHVNNYQEWLALKTMEWQVRYSAKT